MIHVSNLYRIPEGERLADRLCKLSFADTVFFANSGAEAMECVIKMVRKYQSANGHPEPSDHHLRGRLPRPHAGDAGGGQEPVAISTASGPVMDGFDQVAPRRPVAV